MKNIPEYTLRLFAAIILMACLSLTAAYSWNAETPPLTPPAPSMKFHTCNGFTISLPSNWSVETLPSGISYCAAADGMRMKKEADGGIMTSVFLGLVAGFRKTASSTAKAAADEMIRSYMADNPGLRVVLHETAKMDGFPAESVLIESPTGRGGEMERSLMLIAVKNGLLFEATFTSPAREYGRMEGVFRRIVESIRLTSWGK